jgi:hypothetical protein
LARDSRESQAASINLQANRNYNRHSRPSSPVSSIINSQRGSEQASVLMRKSAPNDPHSVIHIPLLTAVPARPQHACGASSFDEWPSNRSLPGSRKKSAPEPWARSIGRGTRGWDAAFAVKLIQPRSNGTAHHLRRFELEARAAAALNHPNIVAIYDVGLDDFSPLTAG